MLIRIMKEEALQTMKQNLPNIFYMYYNNADNSWMWDICGGDPFVDFKEIPDFDLASVDLPKGEIDMENCKTIYTKLGFLTESQATDERLWAGLCNDVFYGYLRKRWGMDKTRRNVKKEKATGEILSRFFFKNGKKAGLYRNSLSKYWWVGHNTYDSVTKFRKLDLIGSNDLTTKINEIFHNYNFSANPVILEGIVEGIGYFNSEGIKISAAEHIRPTLQCINAIGGSTILDCWTSDEIKELFINQLQNVLSNQNQIELSFDEDEIDEFGEIDNTLDLEMAVEREIAIKASEREIRIGDKVTLTNITKSKEVKVVVQFNDERVIPAFSKILLDHHVGDIVEFENCGYQIDNIEEI